MLNLHRSERADGLVTGLCELLADPPADPFAREVVSVPTRGIERWLTQRLSHHLGAGPGRDDGICANVDFPPPRRLIADAVVAACGVDPDEDPWLPERMVWPLLEVVDENLGEPWLRALKVHLDADPAGARRFSAVRHIAGLFDRYALHRPEMVKAWTAGEDGGVVQSAAWQAELWRRLRARIGTADPAARVDAACERLRAQPAIAALPERVSIFGLTRLPAGHLEVLEVIAEHRDVHLFLLHPSPALWDAIADRARGTVTQRAGDPTSTLARNRLLASWGQDVRELQLVVARAGGNADDHHHATAHASGSLLARLQEDVRENRQPPGEPLPDHADERPLLDADDTSVQIHACHGRGRQVEVLRDTLLHLLADDATLEPREVIVMCPDIETFAPLIHATFGAGEVAGEEDTALPDGVKPPDLRVRLADRALRQTNPVLGVVAQLLELADRRLTASQVLDLADREPVRRRFGFDDDSLAKLHDWVAESGIRWGLDADHRAAFKLSRVGAGTWRTGLDRVLVGVAMTEDDHRLFHDVLPLDDVESGAIDLAGRFAELIDRLQGTVSSFSDAKPLSDWADAIAAAADLLTATAPRDAWQRTELQRILGDVTAANASSANQLTLGDIRALLAERLQGRPTRANFRTGHLTVCTLQPMRSVPHRVVCLLGLDDGVFPRKSPRDGDDLMLDDPHVGDRDGRTEDRQMLLDALMAARERLVITYTGNDERTNERKPPAVPVGELLDMIDRTVRTGDGPARRRIVTRHPLQPFDPRNFRPPRPWSFDAVTLDGARALTSGRPEPDPFLTAPLAAAPQRLIDVDDLVRFVQHPIRAFLRKRLGMSVSEIDDEVADALPVEIDALERWGVGQRLLDALLAGTDKRTAALAEIRRGTLPPGALGKPVIDGVLPTAAAIVEQVHRHVAPTVQPRSLDVRVDIPDGRLLTGTVPGVHGDVLLSATYSRLAPKHRLAAWVRLLAITAARPGTVTEAVTVGRGDGDAIAVARIAPPPDPRAHLDVLVDLLDRGMREPLPLVCKTSAAYVHGGVDAARKQWTSGWRFDGEDREPEHQLVFGGAVDLDELLLDGTRPDELWVASETTRFGQLACRLWDGLRRHEKVAEV